MRIGIDIRCLMDEPRSGVGEYAHNLLINLLSQDQTNKYVLFTSGWQTTPTIQKLKSRFEFSARVSFFHLSWPNKILNFFWWLGLGPKLDKLLQVNVIWLPQYSFIKLSQQTKLIITCHDLSFRFLKNFYSLKGRLWHWFVNPLKLYRQASKILAVSQTTKTDLINLGFSQTKIKVVYPIVNWQQLNRSADNYTRSTINNLPTKYFLYIGTLDPRKNIISLLEAYLDFQKKSSATEHLLIAGRRGWHSRTYYQHLFRLINSSPRISYLGYVPLNELPYLYARATAFVYPSFYEGFGFPPLEAMQFDCPVIASGAASIPEVTRGAAYLIDPYNQADITAAFIKLSQDQDWQQRLIISGQAVCQYWQRKNKKSAAQLQLAILN